MSIRVVSQKELSYEAAKSLAEALAIVSRTMGTGRFEDHVSDDLRVAAIHILKATSKLYELSKEEPKTFESSRVSFSYNGLLSAETVSNKVKSKK